MKRLAIIFPGMGYHADKPLLYYTKKLLRQQGFSVLKIVYENLPMEDKALAIKKALLTAKKSLNEISTDEYDEIILVGKSIGTVVAETIKEEIKEKVIGFICFTPINETLSLLNGNILAFSGTKDPWVETKHLQEICKEKELKLYLIENANHSLETGDIIHDIWIQQDVAKQVDFYIRKTIEDETRQG